MEDSDIIETLSQKGVLATFYKISQGNKRVSELLQEGVGSFEEVSLAIDTLVEFDYIKTHKKTKSSEDIIYEITERGRGTMRTLCNSPYPRSLLDFDAMKGELCKSLLELGRKLGKSKYEIDWFYNLGSVVKYNKQEHTDMVKKEVIHLSGGLSILYLFSMFESHIQWSDWLRFGKQLGLSDEKIKILKAYRHIRNSIGHKSHGARAWQHKKDFDRIMSMSDTDMGEERHNIESFRQIVHVDKSDKITIDRVAGIRLHEIMSNLVQQAVARACGN